MTIDDGEWACGLLELGELWPFNDRVGLWIVRLFNSLLGNSLNPNVSSLDGNGGDSVVDVFWGIWLFDNDFVKLNGRLSECKWGSSKEVCGCCICCWACKWDCGNPNNWGLTPGISDWAPFAPKCWFSKLGSS